MSLDASGWYLWSLLDTAECRAANKLKLIIVERAIVSDSSPIADRNAMIAKTSRDLIFARLQLLYSIENANGPVSLCFERCDYSKLV